MGRSINFTLWKSEKYRGPQYNEDISQGPPANQPALFSLITRIVEGKGRPHKHLHNMRRFASLPVRE